MGKDKDVCGQRLTRWEPHEYCIRPVGHDYAHSPRSLRPEDQPDGGEFYLDRLEDESGVSGTGIVARGFEFSDGTCALWWRDSGSLGVYKSLAKVTEIHGHRGKTKIVKI